MAVNAVRDVISRSYRRYNNLAKRRVVVVIVSDRPAGLSRFLMKSS